MYVLHGCHPVKFYRVLLFCSVVPLSRPSKISNFRLELISSLQRVPSFDYHPISDNIDLTPGLTVECSVPDLLNLTFIFYPISDLLLIVNNCKLYPASHVQCQETPQPLAGVKLLTWKTFMWNRLSTMTPPFLKRLS